MFGLRMVTAKKSTNLQAVRSSAEAIMGGSRSANLASGPAGVLWTSCWVMDRPDFWRNFGRFQKDYHNYVYERVYLRGIVVSVLQRGDNSGP